MEQSVICNSAYADFIQLSIVYVESSNDGSFLGADVEELHYILLHKSQHHTF